MAGADRSGGSSIIPLHAAPLTLKRPADWQDKSPPERMWIVEGWLPVAHPTYLTGAGGAGKSLLAQQMATSIALGLPLFGMPTRKQRALYLTCEDDVGELHRRQHSICRSMGINLSDLGDELLLCSRFGEMDNTFLHFNRDGQIEPGQLFNDIKETCLRKAIHFIVLDNLTHLLGPNVDENSNSIPPIFCNALANLSLSLPATFLFLGHPAKSGSEFRGASGWENHVRSRLYLERPADGDASDNRRTLRVSKANYGRTGDELNLLWRDWAFEHSLDQGNDWHEEMAQNSAAAADNILFLELLRERDKQGLPVSARSQSRNFAPKELAKMPKARKVSAERFDRAMHRLLALGTIREAEEINPKDRHKYRRIIECGPVAGQSHGLFASPAQSAANPGNGARGPDDCGPVCGPDIEASAGTAESRANPPENGAGQLPVILGNRGGGEAPPIGGLSPSPLAAPPIAESSNATATDTQKWAGASAQLL